MFALSSGKIDKHGYLTGAEMFPPQSHRTTERSKFTYSDWKEIWKASLWKPLDKETRRIEKYA